MDAICIISASTVALLAGSKQSHRLKGQFLQKKQVFLVSITLADPFLALLNQRYPFCIQQLVVKQQQQQQHLQDNKLQDPLLNTNAACVTFAQSSLIHLWAGQNGRQE